MATQIRSLAPPAHGTASPHSSPARSVSTQVDSAGVAAQPALGALLRRLPLFRSLTPAQLAPVARVLRWRQYQPGATVVSAGQRAEHLFVLVDGRVQVERPGAAGQAPETRVVRPGGSFGAAALLAAERVEVTAIATTLTHVLTLRRARFFQLMQEAPAAASAFLGLLDTGDRTEQPVSA